MEKYGNKAAAQQQYAEALELQPDYAEIHYNYAMLLESVGQTDEAVQHYRSALRLAPEIRTPTSGSENY